MLATLSARPPLREPGWVYEPKLDGVRLLALGSPTARSGRDVALVSRAGKPQNGAYPEVAEALTEQSVGDFVVDGEVVAFDQGRPSFSRLQGRMQLRDPRRAVLTGIAVHFYAFDLLRLEGYDLSLLPLLRRKALLEATLEWGETIRYSRHIEGDGSVLLAEACRQGWEGLVAKRAASPYATGKRSRDWLKLKCMNRQEFVIGGWTDPAGTRNRFGALLVGYHDAEGLRYAGKVGTGFDEARLDELSALLEVRARHDSPFVTASLPKTLARKGVHWVDPDLVAEIGFGEWTHDDRLRHPRFLGLRDDKPAESVVRERQQ